MSLFMPPPLPRMPFPPLRTLLPTRSALETGLRFLPPENLPGLPGPSPWLQHSVHTSLPSPQCCSPASLCSIPEAPVLLGSLSLPLVGGFPDERMAWVRPFMLGATCFGPGPQVLSKCFSNLSSASFYLGLVSGQESKAARVERYTEPWQSSLPPLPWQLWLPAPSLLPHFPPQDRLPSKV